MFHSSLPTVKGVNFGGTCDGFLCVMEIIGIFHCGNFNYRGAFQNVLDFLMLGEPS